MEDGGGGGGIGSIGDFFGAIGEGISGLFSSGPQHIAALDSKERERYGVPERVDFIMHKPSKNESSDEDFVLDSVGFGVQSYGRDNDKTYT